MEEIKIFTKHKNLEQIENSMLALENEMKDPLQEELESFLLQSGGFNQSEFSNIDVKTIVKEQAKKMLEFQKSEIQKAIQLFYDRSIPLEKENLCDIIGKIISLGVENAESEDLSILLTDKDLDFLEHIAKRVILQNPEEAASLYRFFVFLDPTYSSGWIGLAICFQEMGYQDVAEQTYEIALKLINSDNLLRLYAAEFFLLIKKADRAKEILIEAKNELINESKTDSYTYTEVSNLLNHIGGPSND